MIRSRWATILCMAGAVFALGISSGNGTVGGPVSLSALAPADEYFGREKLSPFGIRHKIFSLKDDLHRGRLHPDAIEHDALLTQDALRDWCARFPLDPWLPATAWNLATLYEELPGTQAQTLAVASLQFVRNTFTDTQYGQLAARDLSRGVGVRPWPHWAGPPPQLAENPSTPSPHVSVTHASSPHPSVTRTPAAHATATHTPSPEPSAIALLSRASDPGSLVAGILAQKDMNGAQAAEQKFWDLSKNGEDGNYARAAWELASLYERLPGEDARRHAVTLLALLVDRDSSVIFGRWAMRDLERGIGLR